MSSIRMDQAIEPARKRRRKDADTLATELLASRRLLSDTDVLAVPVFAKKSTTVHEQ